MDSWDKFDQTKFPKYEYFSNILNGYYDKHGEFRPEAISYSDYLRTKEIWIKSNYKAMGDYHDLY
jgi:hypothetical protein